MNLANQDIIHLFQASFAQEGSREICQIKGQETNDWVISDIHTQSRFNEVLVNRIANILMEFIIVSVFLVFILFVLF